MIASVAEKEALLRELEQQIGAVGRRLRRVVADRAESIHPSLNGLAYSVMEQLNRYGEHRQADLVSALRSEKGAISRAVSQLEELGFVVRVTDPADARAVRVAISPEGAARLDELTRERRAAYAARLADWTPEELEAFAATLARYNAALDR